MNAPRILLVEGCPAFQLNYDNADNPFFIRAIKDEVRQVAPGLFLGQAYVVLFGRPRLALYFALASASRPHRTET